MKINQQILSIPPYISTSWKNISSLHVTKKNGGQVLSVVLQNGQTVEIPNLSLEMMNKIFDEHSGYLEKENTTGQNENNPLNFGIPLKFGMEGFEGFGSMMQHTPHQADMPNLPPEVLDKISTLAKSLGVSDSGEEILKPEPHCNCMYCQIAKAIQQSSANESTLNGQLEEEVTDEDLKFRDWDIHQSGDNLYNVTNPFDHQEHYQVFLGQPIGCTCGQKNCEHIRAVLNS